MSQSKSLTCEYCFVKNPQGENSCLACGAPLPKRKPRPPKPAATKTESIAEHKTPLQDERETAEDIDKVYTTAMTVYGTFWRALAEAAVIAMVGFGLGLLGGAVGASFWGAFCAIFVGLVVGLTVKNYYITIISAPIGVVIGAILSAIGWFIGLNPKAMLFIITICATLAASVGGRNYPYTRRNWWEKARPFLGAAGGLAFGILGVIVGAGIRAGLGLIVDL